MYRKVCEQGEEKKHEKVTVFLNENDLTDSGIKKVEDAIKKITGDKWTFWGVDLKKVEVDSFTLSVDGDSCALCEVVTGRRERWEWFEDGERSVQ